MLIKLENTYYRKHLNLVTILMNVVPCFLWLNCALTYVLIYLKTWNLLI